MNILDITKDGNDPYSERQVGVSKKRQEREVNRESRWWIKEKCKSCGKGFRPNSKVNKCHACDRYTHIKKPCTTSNKDGTNFYCVKCKEVEKDAATYEETLDSRNFQCQLCKFSFNHKRNLIRHMKQQHANPIGTTQKEFDMEEEKDEPIVETILEVLKKLDMESQISKFEEEEITIEDVLRMNEDDIKELCKECGITSYGRRFRFVEAIRRMKSARRPIPSGSPTSTSPLPPKSTIHQQSTLPLQNPLPQEVAPVLQRIQAIFLLTAPLLHQVSQPPLAPLAHPTCLPTPALHVNIVKMQKNPELLTFAENVVKLYAIFAQKKTHRQTMKCTEFTKT